MKALGLIFSNIHDHDITELTSKRTLASIPFGGRYRLIDFVLSSMVNSGISKVGVITQNNYQSLMDHVGNGKQWDLSRKNGGLMFLPPYGAGNTGLCENRLDSIKSALSFLRRSNEDFVVLSDCDSVVNIDYTDALAKHVLTEADFTLVYRDKDLKDGDGKRRTVLKTNTAGRVTELTVTDNAQGLKSVWANMIITSRTFLINVVESAVAHQYSSFRNDILRRTDVYKIYGYKYDGYFASVDSLSNYYKHSMELLDKDIRDSLFNRKNMPVLTKVRDSAPSRVAEGAVVRNSMIADGCEIEGTVTNSILFRGVKVKKGAVVDGCIIMQDGVIGNGCNLRCLIADKNVFISDNRVLAGCAEIPYYISKGTNL